MNLHEKVIWFGDKSQSSFETQMTYILNGLLIPR